MNKETQSYIAHRITVLENEIGAVLISLDMAKQQVINHERDIARKMKIIEGLKQMLAPEVAS